MSGRRRPCFPQTRTRSTGTSSNHHREHDQAVCPDGLTGLFRTGWRYDSEEPQECLDLFDLPVGHIDRDLK